MKHRGPRRSREALILSLISLATTVPVLAAGDAPVTLDGLEWAPASNGADVRWADAEAYCRDLALAGHSDWRLPSLAELETLHDPEQPDGVREPLRLDGCCLWSSTTLEERPADDGSATGAGASRYRWGFLFDGGIRYYSVVFQPDGRALCVRDPAMRR